MSIPSTRISLLRAVLEIFGITFLRFPPIQRIWVMWLVAVNAAGLAFIDRLEAQVTLGVVGVVVFLQALIYQRKRFIRLLGTTHIAWAPMLAWIAARQFPLLPAESRFHLWIIALIATNATSLLIDAWDLTRFVSGERSPYYAW